MEDDLKSMQVFISGRSYPLKVKDGEQEVIQNVVDELGEKIRDFQLTYVNKDKQDCLSMALLTYAVDNHRLRQEASSLQVLFEKVDEIDTMLKEALS
ncbi:MAG: cell division protein ZapA [Saprospiraceae bacterium]|nr:cell division protein ZapA [Saprospiraceae bacterium]